MSKEQFKVGDRLRVVNGPKELIDGYKDWIVVVTKLGGWTDSDITTVKEDNGHPLMFSKDWKLELIEEPVVYEVAYPTIPDNVNKVKSLINIFIRSGNSWIDITNNNEVMSERYMIRTYGPLTPVKEEPKKYNLARRINGDKKDWIFFERSLEQSKDYLEQD